MDEKPDVYSDEELKKLLFRFIKDTIECVQPGPNYEARLNAMTSIAHDLLAC